MREGIRLGNDHNPLTTAQVSLNGTSRTPTKVSTDSSNSITQEQTAPRARDYQTLRGISVEIHKGLFDHGYRRAVDGAIHERRDEDVEAITLHAEKAARECNRDVFDVDAHLHDRMYMAEHEKHLADRRDAEEAEKYAYVEMRERAAEAAQAKAGEPPMKAVRIILGVVGAIAIAISFILTFHDVFFPFSDEVLSWFFSFVAASVIGVAIATMILADPGADGQRSAINWVGLTGGILVAIGFGAARLRDATTAGEYLFSLALILFELGILIGLEVIMTRLRSANREYATKLKAERQANALLDEAIKHHQRCQQRAIECDLAVKEDIGYVEERHLRSHHIDDLEQAMIAAGLDGYNAGIAENRGTVLRAKRRS